jgi:hypothetical protein
LKHRSEVFGKNLAFLRRSADGFDSSFRARFAVPNDELESVNFAGQKDFSPTRMDKMLHFLAELVLGMTNFIRSSKMSPKPQSKAWRPSS